MTPLTTGLSPPVFVRCEPMQRGDLIERIAATGIARAGRSWSVRPRISGIIESVPLVEGERVKAGQTLLQLETFYYKIALDESRADYFKACIEYGRKQGERKNSIGRLADSGKTKFLNVEDAKNQLKCVTRDYHEQNVTEEEFIRAKAEYEAAKLFTDPNKEPMIAYQSGLSRSYYNMLKAQQDFEHCSIFAPFNGIVGSLCVRRGDPVSPAVECLKLLDFSHVIVEVGVLETQINYIKPGSAARITLAAVPGEFKGKVIAASPLINQRTRTCEVKIEIGNPGDSLKDGMFATASIDVFIHRNLLLAPKAAILERDSRKLVFILRDSLAKWCYVETGRENDKYVEIKGSSLDLKEGDRVLTEGHFTLVHDARVKTME